MKTILTTGMVLVVLLIFGGIGFYAYTITRKSATSTIVPSFQNPFSGSPVNSFGSVSPTASFTNPFASPTPATYQNPFSTTSSGAEPYQNPFEKLR